MILLSFISFLTRHQQFESITQGIIENNFLGEICNLYSLPSVKFYKGVIQLCLSCAKTVDPANIITTQLQRNNMEDLGLPIFLSFYFFFSVSVFGLLFTLIFLDQDLKNRKLACYEPIAKILISLIQQVQNEKEQEAPYHDLLNCFKICKKADDPLFHYFFYQVFL